MVVKLLTSKQQRGNSMEWIDTISKAIQYVEDHITEDLTVDIISEYVNTSAFYFQKGFSMLCGFSITEYIRKRRLTLAGEELAAGKDKIIDIALKYGYDSPDSFTRAFTRLHGMTPTIARKEQVMLKSFVPLKIKLSLEGGYLMDYKIVNKKAFTVIANEKIFSYEDAKNTIP